MGTNVSLWIDLLKNVGIFGIAAAIIKTIIDGSANRKLEKFKQELTFKTKEYELSINSNLEKYKSEISLHLNRQNKLHEKRLLIIDELYKKLVMLDSSMRQMTAFMKPVVENAEKEEDERVKRAQEAYANYNNYYLYNKLYFTKETSILLDKIRTDYFSAIWDYFAPKHLEQLTGGNASPQGRKDAYDKARLAASKVESEIPRSLELLEDEFRRLLGV